VTWRRNVNNGLSRLTRHQLVQADRLEQLKQGLRSAEERRTTVERKLRSVTLERKTVEKELSAELAAAAAQIHLLEEKLKPKPKPKPKLPPDYAPVTKEIWETVQPRTMTSHGKVNFMVDAMYYIERFHIAGAIVECGVWRGGSMMAGAMALQHLNATHRQLFLFDTFEGMSDPTDRDVHIWHGQTGDEMLAAQKLGAPLWIPASLEDVKAGFEPLGYPEENLHFVVGKVEDTIPANAPDQIAVLRLDTDWYESTKHEIDHLYARLQPGGVLIIDDYGSWQGAKDAVDEFMDATGEPLLLTQVGRGRVAVKPGLATQVPPQA
jgi:O-methyltransferase